MIMQLMIRGVERYSLPWAETKLTRLLLLFVLFVVTSGFGWIASWSAPCLVFPARISIAVGAVLIATLLLDSAAVFYYFFGFSKRRSLDLVRHTDPNFDAIVKRLENLVRTVPAEELETVVTLETDAVIEDYVTNRPLRRILVILIRRTVCNLLVTVAVFSILTGNMIFLNHQPGLKDSPYRDECRPDGISYGRLLVHGFYYHSVIFQSLGDGGHAPTTTPAQILATAESYLAMIYLALLLGGSISVATFVESALTEEVIRKELGRGLLPIWSRRVPISAPGDPRISTA